MLYQGSYQGSYEADAGALCLDFANTLSWRTSDHPHEWLATFANLVRWGELVGILTHEQASQTMVAADKDRELAAQIFARAIKLREAIYRIFSALDSDALPSVTDIETINEELQIAHQNQEMIFNEDHFEFSWKGESVLLDKVLWAIAISCAELLISENIPWVGECEGKGCGWLFLDTSKNHRRRWCSMNDCGNREKARLHYQRKRGKNSYHPDLNQKIFQSPNQ